MFRVGIIIVLFLLSQYSNSQESRPTVENTNFAEIQKSIDYKSLLKKLSFRNIGPSVMGGRVVDLAVNSENPKEFYVAYATGGIWYTKNGGQSFSPIFDSCETTSVGAIAVDWKNKIIWVGTGESTGSVEARPGNGIFKSDDNGRTWRNMGLPNSQFISKIILHPNDRNVLFVAVFGSRHTLNKERGIFRTSDGGMTWKNSLFINSETGAIDLAINPKDPKVLYASVWHNISTLSRKESFGESSGVYKSQDGGINWNLITTNQSGFPTGYGIGRIGITIYPKNPDIIYAVVDNRTLVADSSVYILSDFKNLSKKAFLLLDNTKLDKFIMQLDGDEYRYREHLSASKLKKWVSQDSIKPSTLYESLYKFSNIGERRRGVEIYKSDNGGYTWHKTEKNPWAKMGWFFGKIYVSPNNSLKVYYPNVHLFISEDGFRSFKRASGENTHVDIHACWINPSNDSHIIIGTDGGVNISYDNGEHWSSNNSIPVGQFYSVAVDNATPYNVYGGMQDNGTWTGSSKTIENLEWLLTGQNPYRKLIGGDGMDVQVDLRNNRFYGGQQYGKYFYNAGPTIKPQNKFGEKPYRFHWVTPILLSKHNPDIVYYGSERLLRSFDNGNNFSSISEDLTNGGIPDREIGTIYSISESPVEFGLLYTGTDDGNVHLSLSGHEWKLISTSLKKKFVVPNGAGVSCVLASRHKKERSFVSFNGKLIDDFNSYIFFSDDFGKNWHRLGKGIPNKIINIIVEDPKNENIIYVGTDGGLYISFDRGRSFVKWDAGMPRSVPVTDIAIQERENEIVVATYGRSLYVAKLDEVQKIAKEGADSDKASSAEGR